jgi:hypothetical protein
MDKLLEQSRSMRTLIQGSRGVWKWHADESGTAPNVEWDDFGCVAEFIAAVDEFDELNKGSE